MNAANILSLVRICLVPLLVILLWYERYRYGLAVFTAAAVTDAFDGFLARRLNQKTKLGAYLDPIADKLLLDSSFIVCSVLGIIPVWLTIIVLSRDIIVFLGTLVLHLNAVVFEIRPRTLSKCATFFQVGTVIVTLLLHEVPAGAGYAVPLYLVTGALTTAAAAYYLLIGVRIIKENTLSGES